MFDTLTVMYALKQWRKYATMLLLTFLNLIYFFSCFFQLSLLQQHCSRGSWNKCFTKSTLPSSIFFQQKSKKRGKFLIEKLWNRIQGCNSQNCIKSQILKIFVTLVSLKMPSLLSVNNHCKLTLLNYGNEFYQNPQVMLYSKN